MRRAFTLLEVIVALTIAGIIALAARATLNAGIDTEERLQIHTIRAEGDARFRSLLVQLLRHMTDAPGIGLTPFSLRDTLNGDAGSSHVIEFYSRGLSLAAGSGATLRVRVAPSRDGLTLDGIDADGAARISGIAPGISAMRVRLRAQSGDWIDGWPRTLQFPAAVALEFVPVGNARLPHVPLVVATALEARP